MSGYTIEKPSTELMQNYLQSEIMNPTEQRFRAVESSAGGAALLFSIGTDRSLSVTAELPGDAESHTGWQQFNLSGAATVPAEFSAGGAQCCGFDVARCSDGTLRVAMLLSDKNDARKNDALYLATIQAKTEKAWFKSPAWTRYAYDDPKHPRTAVKIANVFLSEATDGDYTIVDVKDIPTRPENIFRYIIDRDHKDGDPAWQPHALPIEVQADKYASCLGRKADADVDGIYTSGHEGAGAQMVYTPLHGRRGHTPLSDSLHLPGKLVPDAISACRRTDNFSDLYAAAAGGLYYFASDNQHDGAEACAVISGNSLFNKVDRLFASRSGNSAVVWGLNADKEIFYVTCPLDKLTDRSAWSVPLSIMQGVQQVSPFVNQANSANTFFAHTAGNELKIATKKLDARAPASRTWSIRDVHLPLPDKKKQKTPAQQFRSYTTHVKVTGPDKRPAAGKLVSITAPRGVTSVYINHLYYPVGATPIHVPADASGSVTIIEPISRLDGTQFTVSVDGGPGTDINPMQDASTVSERLKTLKKPERLADATIHYQNEKRNPPRKLVLEAKRKADNTDVRHAAANIENLWKAHDRLSGKTLASDQAQDEPSERYRNFVKGTKPIQVDAGDLLLRLESERAHRARAGLLGAQESWWEIIVEWFEKAWQFIVKIGEKIFAFVIEVIEDVYAAFKYVFDKIVEVIEDVIEFVKFLFGLEDLQRTKDVVQHVSNLFLKDQVAYISTLRADFDGWVGSLITEITDWAKPKVAASGGSMTATMGQLRSSAQKAPASASDSYLAYHFSNNVADAFAQGDPDAPPDGTSSLLTKLGNLVRQELDALSKAAADLRDLAQHYDEKTPDDAIRQFVAILAKVLLKTFKNVVDALLTVVEHIADWARRRFTEDPLYIPIVSDILADFGIPEFTVSDLVCWLAAIPLTIGYKLVAGAAPFPDNELTTYLRKDAPDFQSVVKRLNGAPRLTATLGDANTVKGSASPAHSASAAFHIISSITAGILAIAGTAEALSYRQGESASGTVSGIIAFGGAFDNVCRFIALTVVPRVPFSDPGAVKLALAVRSIVLVHKLIFGAVASFNATLAPKYKYVKIGLAGPCTDPILLIMQAVLTANHLQEIRKKVSYGNEENLAIVDEVSNIANYCARLCRDALVLDSIDPLDAEVKAVIAAFSAAFRCLQAELQLGEGVAELALEWPK